jgi:plastocyanin
MRIFFVFFVTVLLVSFCCVPGLIAQEEAKTLTEEQAKEAQKKLTDALKSLKKEIRTEVKVDNGGTITGAVKCKRVRHPEDVVVYIEKVGDKNYPAPEEHGTVDQLNLTYVPHVIAIQKGTTLDFPNSDMVRHNVFTPPECCKQFNLGTYDVGVVKHVTFDEVCDIPLLCNVHAEMSAFIVVLDNPYFSVTGRDGVFKIENVPPGTYKVSAWHEKLRTVTKDVTVESGKASNVDFNLKKKK